MEETTVEKTNHILGYVLIAIGVTVILVCLLNGYGLFKGTAEPARFFSFDGVSLDLGKALSAGMPEELRGQSAVLSQQLFSSDMINDPLNLTVHLFFLWFFAGMGQKLAQLGISLVKVYRFGKNGPN